MELWMVGLLSLSWQCLQGMDALKQAAGGQPLRWKKGSLGLKQKRVWNAVKQDLAEVLDLLDRTELPQQPLGVRRAAAGTQG
jgi:hypothetical protein